jgi:SWI/SNF-related matrix-associated actin-dependent regulator 1 of chromatin subfamily A
MKSEVLKDLPTMTRALVPIAGRVGVPGEVVRRAIHHGAVQEGPMASIRRKEGEAKTPAVVEYCKTLFEGGVGELVVFAYHRDVITALAAALPAAVQFHGGMTPEQKHQAVHAFQTGAAKTFVGQIDSAGVGITLTKASRVVFAEYSWTPALMRQAADRICRIGQSKPCQEDWLYVPGTLDEAVMRVLDRKAKVFGAVVEGRITAADLEKELAAQQSNVF